MNGKISSTGMRSGRNGRDEVIKLYHKGIEVRRVIEYLPDGKVRIDRVRKDKGTITITVDSDEIELREE